MNPGVTVACYALGSDRIRRELAGFPFEDAPALEEQCGGGCALLRSLLLRRLAPERPHIAEVFPLFLAASMYDLICSFIEGAWLHDLFGFVLLNGGMLLQLVDSSLDGWVRRILAVRPEHPTGRGFGRGCP